MRYPEAEWRPLPENRTEPRIHATQAVAHSIVGSAEGAYGFFLNSTSLESHFIMRLDGSLIQLIDTSRQADAQFRANARALSVETEDNGNPDSFPWTPEQLVSLVRLFNWMCDTHDVGRRLAPTWDASGVGYHSLFPGLWTPVRGKTCPGVVRRRQFMEFVLPAVVDNRQVTMEDAMEFVKKGDKGESVRFWQQMLYYVNPQARPKPIAVDGHFGDETEEWVRAILGERSGPTIQALQAALILRKLAERVADDRFDAATRGLEQRIADAVLARVAADIGQPTRDELVALVDAELRKLVITRKETR